LETYINSKNLDFDTMDILKDLFDEKIIEILNLLVDNPSKTYSLTEISELTSVNVTTTFRIIKKLIEREFLTEIKVSKAKVYQLSKNEKTLALMTLLKKNTGPLQKFIEELSKENITKIILETKENDIAKLLIVSDIKLTEKIKKITESIKNNDHFNIEFVELSEDQYEGLKKFSDYNLEKKIIFNK
jgi:DNA-binding Lrp family transcriptional regulator